MVHRKWKCGCAVFLSTVALSGMLVAQAEGAGSTQEAKAGEATSESASVPQAGPKFLNLRYDEDFTYLDGAPGSFTPDFFDPVKNMSIDGDWRLSLGGEFRARLEAETNKAFGSTEPAQDTFENYRIMVHLDLIYGKSFRLFAQGVLAFDERRDLAPRGLDENRADLQQLFFDLRLLGDDLPLTLRVGRQDLQYGAERMVSPLDWSAVRRRFDGVKLFAKGDTWDVDLWYTRPINIGQVQRAQPDNNNEEYDFWGAYVTYKGIPRHGLDVYFFGSDKTFDTRNPNGKVGDETRYTLGSRFWGKTDGLDYEAEAASQWGNWAGDRIKAWSWTVDGGYTFPDIACKPRIGAGIDWASGDKSPGDGDVGTFDQLFPLGHKYLGYMDLIGRKNITAANVNMSAWPVAKKVKTALAYHTFWLNANEDALYNAGGGGGRRDATGNSGTEVGSELDLTVLWKLDVHSSVLLGYSHFWHSDFIRQTGPSEDADFLYVQYGFKF